MIFYKSNIYNLLLKHIIGYFSNPSPETILYGIVLSEHFSSISHPNNTQIIVIDLIHIFICLPASGVAAL